MIVDFHTHAFPDAIAEKAIRSLSATSGLDPYGNGTQSGLCEHLKNSGTDYGVVLNIAVKPHQASHINASALSYDGFFSKDPAYARLIQFGSLHPLSETLEEDAKAIKSAGLKGVKIHPDYQGLDLDDPRWSPLFELCVMLKLPLITHAGLDPLCPEHIHATPEHIKKVLSDFPDLIFIASHMGGVACYDAALALLAGRFENLYFDTAFTRDHASAEQMKRIISHHGSERILFGSDYPWDSSLLERQWIESLPLTERERENILGENARKLLSL